MKSYQVSAGLINAEYLFINCEMLMMRRILKNKDLRQTKKGCAVSLQLYSYEISQHTVLKRIGDDMRDRCALPRSSSNQHIAGCMQMALSADFCRAGRRLRTNFPSPRS
jgi:hypothetical protein